MTRKDRPPGDDSRGPEDTSPAGRESFVIVLTEDWLRRNGRTPAADEHARQMRTGRIKLDRLLYGGPPARFTPPSSYGLPAVELAGHIRELRRDGWQAWEIRARFDAA